MSRLLRSPAMAWGIAALLAVLHLAHGAPTTPAATPSPATTAAPTEPAPAPNAETPPAASEAPLSVLEACRVRLERCRTRQDPDAPAGEPQAAPVAVAGGAAPAPSSVASRSDDGEPAAQDPDTAAPALAEAERMVARLLDVPAGEARWLREYVCAVGDLRDDTLNELRGALRRGDADADLEPLLAEARKQRRAVLDDLEARLGEERYGALRAIGGLSLLGGVLECARPR